MISRRKYRLTGAALVRRNTTARHRGLSRRYTQSHVFTMLTVYVCVFSAGVEMQSYPSPPRRNSSPPPHPLIRYENQPAHDLGSGAWSIADKSKPASSHTPRRPGPQFPAPGRTNLAGHSSAPSLRSLSPPVIQGDKLCGGTEDDHDAVVRLPLEPGSLRDRYSNARRAIAKVMPPLCALSRRSRSAFSRGNSLQPSCGIS